METLKPDICVIGAGSGGLTVAAGASQMGAEVVLIERGKMGGDCLNYGCVPSKSLLAAAHVAAEARRSRAFGIDVPAPAIDMGRVADHVDSVIAAIAPNDSVARFEGLGVTVLAAEARFTGPREVVAGDRTIRARRFVLATGSVPAVPPIEGLETTPFFTNETIFANRRPIDHLIVIGGGPIGAELAQAYVRLGSRVTVLEMDRILPKDDPELAEVVRLRLAAEGVTLREGVKVKAAAPAANGVAITMECSNGSRETLSGGHLLVATGRRAGVEGLDLEAAGIDYDRAGIRVDAGLRTSNNRVYAIGDAAGGLQFTHVAGYHAGVVLKNALFRLPSRADAVIPWVTYTDPELAQVGLCEAEARARHGRITALRWPFAENDRAQCERRTDGLVKAIATPRGRILGATIVGVGAGDLIQPWALALRKRMKVGDLAQTIAPYPTRGEASKRAAGSFYLPKLFGPGTRRIVRLLAKLG